MKWLPIFFLFLFSAQTGAFDEGDLKKLKATNACVKCDLSGTNLSGENLKGANLFRANLTRANLTDADLTNAIMMKAIVQGAIFCRTIMPDETLNNSGC